jgi:hypothetical protein
MKSKLHSLFIALTLIAGVQHAAAQGNSFTYQGRLNTGTNPVTGLFDLTFSLYNDSVGSSLRAGPVTNSAVPVTNGLFTVLVNFGAGVFTGSSNWLSIGVRSNGTAVAFSPLTPLQQVTPTPYAIFAEGANAAGLSGSIPPGVVPDASLPADVALTDASQTFTGNNSFTGNLNMLNPSSTIVFPATGGANNPMMEMFSSGTLNADRMVIAHSPFFPTWGLQYQDSSDKFNFLSAGTPVLTVNLGAQSIYTIGNVGIGTTAAAQQFLSVHGGLNLDQANVNDGHFNNGSPNGYGLSFGSSSGEGIASQRQTGLGGNQFGLDFYTEFARRMSISQGGLVGINVGTNLPANQLEVNGGETLDGYDLLLLSGVTTNNGYGLGYRTGLPGICGNGPFLYGFNGGALGGLLPNTVSLSWDYSGNVWVSNNLSTASLTVRGNYLVVNGGTPVFAYIGDDGFGNDVQIGSQKAGVTALACYNTADNAYMHLYCSSITIEGGADLAEPFKITSGKDEVPQGAVVVIDEENPGHLKLSDSPYDTRVAGVVSGANGISPGIQMEQQGVLEGGKNVALTGRVYVQADASNGAIRPGDMLTTSSTPGCAMKVTDHARAVGAILGKAMTGLSEGKGMVLVLVTLQ